MCLNRNKYVIDASIMGVISLEAILEVLKFDQSKVVLTSVTCKELQKMRRFKDFDALDAAKILRYANQDEEHKFFEKVEIDEDYANPDDCIIKYCKSDKDVILLTSDREMHKNAQYYGVRSIYLRKFRGDFIERNIPRIRTPDFIISENDNLFISGVDSNKSRIVVVSDGLEKDCSKEKYQLTINDDIFVAQKYESHVVFLHYRVINLQTTSNCELIYSKNIYEYVDYASLKNLYYRQFMRVCKDLF